jgi:hypothetical protein
MRAAAVTALAGASDGPDAAMHWLSIAMADDHAFVAGMAAAAQARLQAEKPARIGAGLSHRSVATS